MHNALSDDSPYFGLYDKKNRKAYIVADLYSPSKNDCYRAGDSLPYIYADTRPFRMAVTKGFTSSISLPNNKFLEALGKDTVNFLKF